MKVKPQALVPLDAHYLDNWALDKSWVRTLGNGTGGRESQQVLMAPYAQWPPSLRPDVTYAALHVIHRPAPLVIAVVILHGIRISPQEGVLDLRKAGEMWFRSTATQMDSD